MSEINPTNEPRTMDTPDGLPNLAPYLTRKKVAERYAKSTRTIERWEQDPRLGFPKPLEVNGHYLHSEPQLIRWERARVVNSNAP
jgi:hypothetical protein